MNPATIRADIKTRLTTVSGLNCYDTVPGAPQTPAAVVFPDDPFITEHETMGSSGYASVRFTVQILVQQGDFPSMQNALDAYCAVGSGETNSVFTALEWTSANPSGSAVGGGAVSVTVEQVDGYGMVQIGDNQYGSVLFHVTVPASRA